MLKAIRAGLMEGLCWRDTTPPHPVLCLGAGGDARGLFAAAGTWRSPSCPNFPFPEQKGHPQRSITSSAWGGGPRRTGHLGVRWGWWVARAVHCAGNYKGDTKSHTPHFV